MTNSLEALFLAQSSQDSWDDYMRSINREDFTCWDYVVLTASNEQQAEGFQKQIEMRRALGVLPGRTVFTVLSDPDGKRVGSGGATLGVLQYLARETGRDDFGGLRVLVIHSGGDSKRVPQYSALGKLFSPVPRMLPDGRASTLFDEFIIAMAGVPSRIREGMLMLSGDVLLLFNPLQIDFSGKGAAVISFKEDVETGKNHGVFLCGEDGRVRQFLHKQTVETLMKKGAVNNRNCVDIDTGAVIFSTEIMQALYRLVKDNPDKYINERVRLSLYGDFQFPLAADSTLEQYYHEKPEGNFCEELTEARRAVWAALRPFCMKLLRLAPAKFIHFGTTREILELMSSGVQDYANLEWKKNICSSIADPAVSGYMSVLSSKAECREGTYLEVSNVQGEAKVGRGCVISFVDLRDETVPDHVVLHGLKQRDGRFAVRIYKVEDNPKGILEDGCSFLGTTLEELISRNGLSVSDLWESEDHSLWTAKLYPVCDTIHDAVKASLNIAAIAEGRGDLVSWKNADRTSLKAAFNEADPDALLAWEKRMGELVRMDMLAKQMHAGKPVSQINGILSQRELTQIQSEWMEEHIAAADFSEKIRLYYYVGRALGGAEGEKYISRCFHVIQEHILSSTLEQLQENTGCRIQYDEHMVRLPLRVNWGGGWSDTPPYCNEHGGTVLNAAILLNGKRPVTVRLTRLAERKIVFASRDMDVYGEFDRIEELQSVGDPYDPYVLQKAALLACGILPAHGGNLECILERLGGGLRMDTEVVGVPKGSGLGTSSILAAACVKALFEFTGIRYSEQDLYDHVLVMEQIMSTGGGWQDQVGGVTDGIKFITSRPGLKQDIRVEHIQIPEEAKRELGDRFLLIYTGQRRLARNLLRDVVGRYIGNEQENVDALNQIQRIAALMRFELERGHIDDFAGLLSEHWTLSRRIDAGSSNTLIDHIFGAIEDMLEGKMICGAGGGGFLQAILKKGVTKVQVEERLKQVFQDTRIDVWDAQLL